MTSLCRHILAVCTFGMNGKRRLWYQLDISGGSVKRVTLVYFYHVNHPQKLSIAKLDFVQICGMSLNFYNNTLRKFYKFSDSRQT